MTCDMGLRGAMGLLQIPHSVLKYNSESVKLRNKGNICWSSYSFQLRVRKQIGCQFEGHSWQMYRIFS